MLLSCLNSSFCNSITTSKLSVFDNLRQNKIGILPCSISYMIKIFLFGSNEFNLISNKTILSTTKKKSISQTIKTIWFFLCILYVGTLGIVTKVSYESTTCYQVPCECFVFIPYYNFLIYFIVCSTCNYTDLRKKEKIYNTSESIKKISSELANA